MAKKLARCAIKGCNNTIPKGRRKYCSGDCQIQAARKLTRNWRKKRDQAHQEESASDVPARIRRYKIKGGGEIYGYLKESSLISNRNPMGSRYVDDVTRWVDTLWPGESADCYSSPAHRILIAAPDERSKDTSLHMFKELACLGVEIEMIYARDDSQIFTKVQDYRPTILLLYNVKQIGTVVSRIEQFRQEGMVVIYIFDIDPLPGMNDHVDVAISLVGPGPIDWKHIRDFLFKRWKKMAKKNSWLT